MYETMVSGEFPDEICGDCGKKGCSHYYRGFSVPGTKEAFFCGLCGRERIERGKKGEKQKPLGFRRLKEVQNGI